jgi:5'-nucleotidase
MFMGEDGGMRILLTNDDGIDSVGLHVLARAMRRHGEVVVVAPDKEYSGAGASLGALHLIQPEVHRAQVDGIDEAWSVSGPPALCVMFARLGAFGEPFDLVVSGINPGANVGRAVYHSGTIGAALTGRNGFISGVAVSQAVRGGGVEGQGWDEMLIGQQWDSAATVADQFVEGLVANMPSEPVVVNINVPNISYGELKGWRNCPVGMDLPRRMSTAMMEPKEGHQGAFYVRMEWGDSASLLEGTDGAVVNNGEVAITYLSRLTAEDRPDLAATEQVLSAHLPLLG